MKLPKQSQSVMRGLPVAKPAEKGGMAMSGPFCSIICPTITGGIGGAFPLAGGIMGSICNGMCGSCSTGGFCP